MNHITKTIEEEIAAFDKQFAPQLFDPKEQERAMATYLHPNSYDSMVKAFLRTSYLKILQSVEENIEALPYPRDMHVAKYRTQVIATLKEAKESLMK